MIIVSIFDPSTEPQPFIKQLSYDFGDWPETKALAKGIEALLDKAMNS